MCSGEEIAGSLVPWSVRERAAVIAQNADLRIDRTIAKQKESLLVNVPYPNAVCKESSLFPLPTLTAWREFGPGYSHGKISGQ
jgi:hypothetical protein